MESYISKRADQPVVLHHSFALAILQPTTARPFPAVGEVGAAWVVGAEALALYGRGDARDVMYVVPWVVYAYLHAVKVTGCCVDAAHDAWAMVWSYSPGKNNAK